MVRCAYCGDPITRSDQGCRNSSRFGQKCTADIDPLPLPDVHSNCCWCGTGFLGRSGEVKGCPASPSGKHEHVAGHTHRHNTAADALGEPRLSHGELHALHPQARPVVLCVWCGSGLVEGETCDERPWNQSGKQGHQSREMAQRSMAAANRHGERMVEWLGIVESWEKGDRGDALHLFVQALDRAWAGGKREARIIRERIEEKRS